MRNALYLFLLGLALLTLALVVRSGLMARKEPGRPINAAIVYLMGGTAAVLFNVNDSIWRAAANLPAMH